MKGFAIPATTPDYMAIAWANCLHWAAGDAEVIAEFRKATGNTWIPAADGFGRAIDRATGADKDFAAAFVTWFNETIWGDVEEAG